MSHHICYTLCKCLKNTVKKWITVVVVKNAQKIYEIPCTTVKIHVQVHKRTGTKLKHRGSSNILGNKAQTKVCTLLT